jgi:vacuolar-type H+-ATPase subunit I/STV1
MLSTQPPPLPTEIVEMKALAERMGIERFDVQIRGLNDSELEQISERATKEPTKAQRKMGMSRGAPDFTRQKRLIVATAMMVPNLKNPELLDKYGPRDEDVVQKWFLSGEIDQLSEAVNDMSGYGAGAVERAKE